jgi:hypothetical protein
LDQAIISRLIQVLTKGIFMFLALAISASLLSLQTAQSSKKLV